jgi:putative addiction module component (TIGR02574 family)
MIRDADSIFSAALALPPKKRADLAHRLLRSLDGPEPTAAEQAEIDAAWAAEIERREKELDEGQARLIPFEDVMAEAEEILSRPKGRKGKS